MSNIITLRETGYLCTQEAYDDAMELFGVDLHDVKPNEYKVIKIVEHGSEISVYTLSTKDNHVEIIDHLI